ncbi:protein BANP isoform X5 [Hemitrygon akajei]|uniref:protein BANP isoform X5 n=1 Tax=Hemitrygon akajei TaxID=2704970 RepID=UPI003BF99959
MMSEHDLTDVVQIAVEDLTQDQTDVLENHQPEDGAVQPAIKRPRVEITNGQPIQDATIKSILFDFNQAICFRLDSIEAKIQAVEATCKAIEEKIDLALNKHNTPIQVPMVAGSPLGATQTWNKVRSTVPQTTVILNSDRQNPLPSKISGQEEAIPRGTDTIDNILSNSMPGRRQNTIIVKVPGHEDSHTEDIESGSETSDTISNSGQSGGQNLAPNVTLITLNSEEDFPNGTWLGDENNPEMRVRSPITPADMLHVATNCRTAEKMALTLLDYLFHREVQAVSNLSGQGKHGKKQLDPLMIYGIRCHLFHKFGISESDWYRIKQSIDSKCRTAWRRKQRGQSLAVKGFARRTPLSSVTNGADGMQESVPSSGDLQQNQAQTLHYALANAQQVHIHRIGEDGQVQQVGNLQIHQVHVSQDGQVLQGAQLIAVASAEHQTSGVDGSPLQGSDIQVQYVQLAPIADHATAAQGTEALAATIQPEIKIEHGAIQIQQGENGEVVSIQMPVNTVSS